VPAFGRIQSWGCEASYNGKEFTDRFCATGQRQPTGAHAFYRVCTANRSEHRLTKPRTPQTNGMIERFNGRIAEVLATTRFDSAEHFADTIKRYVKVYNQHIPQNVPIIWRDLTLDSGTRVIKQLRSKAASGPCRSPDRGCQPRTGDDLKHRGLCPAAALQRGANRALPWD